MRQSGIVAAAGIYALDHHVHRLVEDHNNARLLAEMLTDIPEIDIKPEEVETNMVYFDVLKTGSTAAELSNRLLEGGVRISPMGDYKLRAVTYIDISHDDILFAAKTVSESLI